MVQVVFLGTADAFSSGGRGHTSVLVEDSQGRLLVDCGATTPHALARLGIERAGVGAVALTHLHGDHFAGTAFLLLEGAKKGRGPLLLAGPPLAASRVEALFRTLYPTTADRPRGFFLEYRELEPGEAIDLGGRRLVAFEARHPAGAPLSLSYRLETDGRTLAFSGDTGPEADLEALAAGADLFVCECSLAREERSPKHLSVDDVERRRPGWTAKRVVLTHLSEASRREAAALSGVEVADDGLVVEL